MLKAQATRGVGENALQKTLRLLKKFEEEFIEEGSGDYLVLRLHSDGTGILTGSYGTVFGFTSPEELNTFLSGSLALRLRMMRNWAKSLE